MTASLSLPFLTGYCRLGLAKVLIELGELYVRLGRRSEAIGMYQRFSHALHTKLGIPPTQETVSLYHTITKPQSVE